jgi:hypothetical protein
MNPTYTCKYCLKQYSRVSCYERHVIACETKRIKTEDVIVLTNTELTEMVLNLVNRVNKLELENSELKKYVKKQKKKIDIFDWLNKNKMVEVDFEKYIENIEITNEDLNNVFKSKDNVDALSSLIIKQFPIENHRIFPIVTFCQKQNIFYVYKNNKWSIMKEKDYTFMVNKISKSLIKYFNNWFEKNKNGVFNNENVQNKYLDNLEKILGKSHKIVENQKKIKSILFDYFKYNIKDITEYQFTF